MTDIIETTGEPAPELTPGIAMCDEPGCTELAVSAYVYEWGEKGVVCARHQIVKSQVAKNTKRSVQFMPLNPLATPPLTRDERTQMKAQVLVAQEELEESRLRGGEMYHQIQKLSQRVSVLELEKRELTAQLTEAKALSDLADDEIEKRKAEVASLSDEVARLKVLVPPPAPPPVGPSFEE